MALWKDQFSGKKEPPPAPPAETTPKAEAESSASPQASYDRPRRVSDPRESESLIASSLTIEGTIEGSGHVRIAGRFKGDVHVEGDLTIEAGAKLTGGVRARRVVIGGELEGNIDGAASVELLATGILNGDLKAGTLSVAAGSKMRGQVEFGWGEKEAAKAGMRLEASAAS
jgi:cytoskeletal protein CcmA (bactofilin family)